MQYVLQYKMVIGDHTQWKKYQNENNCLMVLLTYGYISEMSKLAKGNENQNDY